LFRGSPVSSKFLQYKELSDGEKIILDLLIKNKWDIQRKNFG